MTIKDRLKKLRQEKQMTLEEVSRIVGVSRQTIQKYENGIISNIPSDKIELLAKALSTTPAYLMGWEEEETGNPEKTSLDKLKIPILGTVPAGIPISAIEDILGYEEIPQSMGRLDGLFALRAKGDSMEPNILEGDIIIVQQQPSADSGDIVVALVNGDEATVKKIKITKSGIMLIANNAAYTPMFYTNKEVEELPVRIAGRVIGLHREF